MEDLVKFESEEIDLEGLELNQIVSKLSENEDYIENLEFENRMFAEFLESLGYTQVQISDISMRGKLELDIAELKNLINHQLDLIDSIRLRG